LERSLANRLAWLLTSLDIPSNQQGSLVRVGAGAAKIDLRCRFACDEPVRRREPARPECRFHIFAFEIADESITKPQAGAIRFGVVPLGYLRFDLLAIRRSIR